LTTLTCEGLTLTLGLIVTDMTLLFFFFFFFFFFVFFVF
jgi:hypothetical protein